MIQTYSPPEFRGRTMSIFSMNMAVITIGAMAFGTLSGAFGARWSVAIMGTIGALSMVALYVGMPKARFVK